jgi:hypothetical protein
MKLKPNGQIFFIFFQTFEWSSNNSRVIQNTEVRLWIGRTSIDPGPTSYINAWDIDV